VELAGLDEGEFGQVCYPDFVLATETVLSGGPAGPPSVGSDGKTDDDRPTVPTAD
jgi:hypothetical protein